MVARTAGRSEDPKGGPKVALRADRTEDRSGVLREGQRADPWVGQTAGRSEGPPKVALRTDRAEARLVARQGARGARTRCSEGPRAGGLRRLRTPRPPPAQVSPHSRLAAVPARGRPQGWPRPREPVTRGAWPAGRAAQARPPRPRGPVPGPQGAWPMDRWLHQPRQPKAALLRAAPPLRSPGVPWSRRRRRWWP